MAIATDTRTSGAGLTGRIGDLFARLREARARHAVYNRTVRELSALSNRDLTDLGIARADIPSVAREAAAGM